MKLGIALLVTSAAAMTILLIGGFAMMAIAKAPAPSALHALNAMAITFVVGLCIGYWLKKERKE